VCTPTRRIDRLVHRVRRRLRRTEAQRAPRWLPAALLPV